MSDQTMTSGGPTTAGVSTTPHTPNGLPLSSIGKRFGGYLLEIVLGCVTLGIGWLVWACIVAANGQTPAKQLLKMRVVKPDTGKALTWGGMFVREIIFRGIVLMLLSVVTLGIMGIVGPLLILGGTMRQTLWDRMAGTVVVDDPGGVALR
jgi:uncharacterized RDD family membrane protein YckC